MPARPTPLPGSLGTAFTRSAARELGVSDGRLRRSDLATPFQGVRTIRNLSGDDEPTGRSATVVAHRRNELHPAEAWRERQRSLVSAYLPLLRANGRQFFAARTAAVLWGLPVPPGESDDLDVGVLRPATRPQRRGIRGCSFSADIMTVTTLRGVPILDPISVWMSLGLRLGHRDLVALTDALIHVPRLPGRRPETGKARVTKLELEERLTGGTVAGRRRLRLALARSNEGSVSVPESHLRLVLEDAGFPKPTLDHDVYGERGRFLGCTEIVFPQYRLGVEYEGDHHRTSRAQWNRDIEKYRDYAGAGWEVVRVTAALLYGNPRALIAQVGEALRRRGWDGQR